MGRQRPLIIISISHQFIVLFLLFEMSKGLIMPQHEQLQRLSPEQSAKLAQECGHSTEMMPNGREHPWAISFMTKGRNKLGGTIISPHHILTVAHGFIRFDNSGFGPCEVFGYRRMDNLRASWSVAYGSDCIRTDADDPVCSRANVTHNKIRAIFVDDAFASGGCIRGHDWAIVELEEPIQFSPRVQPICLPQKNRQHIPEGQHLKVMSWGRKDAFHKGDILIREIPMRHDAECKGRPWADNMPTEVEDYLCAKALNPKDFHTARTCHGDSGSGMEWRRPGFSRMSREMVQMPVNSNSTKSSMSDNKENQHNSTEDVDAEKDGRIETPVAKDDSNKTASTIEMAKGKDKKGMASRQVLHSPLFIPELDFMRKWPIRMRAAKRHRMTAADDEVIRILGDAEVGEQEANEGKQRREDRQMPMTTTTLAQCELVGVTSYGSRQCASDELARFTRISVYLEKICALTGICYPLDETLSGG